jgi:threonine/homoserine/homoserine lactone efflux protein
VRFVLGILAAVGAATFVWLAIRGARRLDELQAEEHLRDRVSGGELERIKRAGW